MKQQELETALRAIVQVTDATIDAALLGMSQVNPASIDGIKRGLDIGQSAMNSLAAVRDLAAKALGDV